MLAQNYGAKKYETLQFVTWAIVGLGVALLVNLFAGHLARKISMPALLAGYFLVCVVFFVHFRATGRLVLESYPVDTLLRVDASGREQTAVCCHHAVLYRNDRRLVAFVDSLHRHIADVDLNADRQRDVTNSFEVYARRLWRSDRTASFVYSTSLFQHIGTRSSNPGQIGRLPMSLSFERLLQSHAFNSEAPVSAMQKAPASGGSTVPKRSPSPAVPVIETTANPATTDAVSVIDTTTAPLPDSASTDDVVAVIDSAPAVTATSSMVPDPVTSDAADAELILTEAENVGERRL